MATTTNATAKKSYPAVFKCRECGKVLIIPCEFVGKGSARGAGSKSSTAASNAATSNLLKVKDKARQQVNREQIFTHALPNGTCDACHKGYPWNYVFRGLVKAIAIAVFLLIVFTSMEMDADGLWVLWITFILGIFGSIKLTEQIFEILARKKVDEGPEDNLKYPYLIIKDTQEATLQTIDKVLKGEREAEVDRKKIIPWGIAPVVIALLVLIIPITSASFNKKMKSVDLFTQDSNAGNKSIVLHVDGRYKTIGLSSDEAADSPDEVGYVYRITEERVKVGEYFLQGSHSTTSFTDATRIDYIIEKYDRHTGQVTGSVYLEGSNPPTKTKTGSKTSGNPPTEAEVIKAIKEPK